MKAETIQKIKTRIDALTELKAENQRLEHAYTLTGNQIAADNRKVAIIYITHQIDFLIDLIESEQTTTTVNLNQYHDLEKKYS